jgi:hypothetical protein
MYTRMSHHGILRTLRIGSPTTLSDRANHLGAVRILRRGPAQIGEGIRSKIVDGARQDDPGAIWRAAAIVLSSIGSTNVRQLPVSEGLPPSSASSGSNLTFESQQGFPADSIGASLAYANGNFHYSQAR